MSRLFLYQLFRHSKKWFLTTVVFMAAYAFLFFKKMDMVFFPYNDMFSGYENPELTQEIFRLKVNGHPLPVTDLPYWKKDLLEVSVNKFASYSLHDKRNRLAIYFENQSRKKIFPQWFRQNLFPGEVPFKSWGSWYVHKCGWGVLHANDTLSIMKYEGKLVDQQFYILDSTIIVQEP